MKNIGRLLSLPLFIGILTILVSSACTKDEVVIDDIDDGEEVVEVYEKKGAAFSLSGMNWSKQVGGLKPFWSYTWGNELNTNQPDNVEYVPMFWGKTITDEKIEELKQLAAEGKIKYLLGFNEPDGVDQANMTVDEAIALWSKLEQVGVPLGSPATVGILNDWLKEFMTKASAQGLRIDFMCVHSYGGANFANLKEKLEQTYNEFGKPIWITEFAVGDWNAATPEDNKYTTAQVLSFMKEALPALDKMEFVERYAWFSANVTNPALTSSALYDENDNLTALGMYYANHTPNMAAGPGKEAVIYPNIEGNLIPNGNFGDYHVYGDPDEKAAESVGWFGYQFAVEPSDAVEGYAGKMKNEWSGDSGLNNKFSVESGKTYAISFYVKWLGKNGSIKMTLKDHDAIIAWEEAGKPSGSKPAVIGSSSAVKADVDGNNDWTKVNFEYTVPEGISNLRLTLWKPKGSAVCLIDEVVAKEK